MNLFYKSICQRSWRHGLEAKTTCCFSKKSGFDPQQGSRSGLLHSQTVPGSSGILCINPTARCSKRSVLSSFEPNSKFFHFIIFQPLSTAIVSLPNPVFSKLASFILSPIAPYTSLSPELSPTHLPAYTWAGVLTIKVSPHGLQSELLASLSDCGI